MIELEISSMDEMSCVTTVVGGPTSGEPRLLLTLHMPDEDIHITIGNADAIAFLRRAITAMHRDAVGIGGLPELRSRAFHYVPGPQPQPLWRQTLPAGS